MISGARGDRVSRGEGSLHDITEEEDEEKKKKKKPIQKKNDQFEQIAKESQQDASGAKYKALLPCNQSSAYFCSG